MVPWSMHGVFVVVVVFVLFFFFPKLLYRPSA